MGDLIKVNPAYWTAPKKALKEQATALQELNGGTYREAVNLLLTNYKYLVTDAALLPGELRLLSQVLSVADTLQQSTNWDETLA